MRCRNLILPMYMCEGMLRRVSVYVERKNLYKKENLNRFRIYLDGNLKIFSDKRKAAKRRNSELKEMKE